ncbi:MAG: UbiA prenyltransferase family protein [Methanobacteriota archaeon]
MVFRLPNKPHKAKYLLNFTITGRQFSFYELISYVAMFASVPMLAYGINRYNLPVIITIYFTILGLYSGFFATLIWNDISDVEIDAIAHPTRILPSRKISVQKFFATALIFSVLTFMCTYLVSLWCFILVVLTALFVTIHNKYLKKIVRLPAYSEIFTPMQWVIVPIFGFLAIWTTLPPTREVLLTVPILGYISFDWFDFQNMILLVLFTYFADNAHDLPEGIHDAKGDRELGVRTYATSFGEKNAARISFIMLFLSGILGIILFLRIVLNLVFVLPFLALWLYTLYTSYTFLRTNPKEMEEQGGIIGQKIFRYFWLTYDLIFLDILIQIAMHNIISFY